MSLLCITRGALLSAYRLLAAVDFTCNIKVPLAVVDPVFLLQSSH